jgi:pimeloyl-ACP methyl ester carboxylesterase
VANDLRAAGHLVYHPSLDGCGERAHAIRAEITLDSAGAEIAGLLFYEDLSEVILVGTSSGGMVVARAAELARDRIRRLVFIDALAPLPGETVAEINGRAPAVLTELTTGLPPDEIPAHAFADVAPPAIREWAAARYTPHPLALTEDAVDLREFWSQTWQVDVLRCTQSRVPREDHQRRTAERLGGTYREMDAGHYPMLTHPDEVARYLLALA